MSSDADFDLLGLLEELDHGVVDGENPRPPPGPTFTTPTATFLPGPPDLRPDFGQDLIDDLRLLGVVSAGRAVEVVRAISVMVTSDESGRRSASCLIRSIARKSGLVVHVEDDPVAWPDEDAEEFDEPASS
jgi:hypothetical protein